MKNPKSALPRAVCLRTEMADTAKTTTMFTISRKLRKESMLPDRRIYSICKDEQMAKADVSSTIKSKGLLFDEISSLKDRSMVLTIQGLLIIYCSDDSGYVLPVRGVKKLLVSTSNILDNEKFVRLVLKFRFGTIHMYCHGNEGIEWRDAIYSMYHGKSTIEEKLTSMTPQVEAADADTDSAGSPINSQDASSDSDESHETAVEPQDSPLPSPQMVQFPVPQIDLPLPSPPTPHFPVVLPAMRATATHTKPYANPVRIYEHAPVNREVVRHHDRPEKSIRTGCNTVKIIREKLEREAKSGFRPDPEVKQVQKDKNKRVSFCEQIAKVDILPTATPCISTASITLQSPSPSLPSPQDDPINTSILPSDDFFHPVDPSRFFICDDATDPRRSSIYRRGSSAFDYDGLLSGPSPFQDDVISSRSDDLNVSALPIIHEESEDPKEDEPAMVVVEEEAEKGVDAPRVNLGRAGRRSARFPTMAINPKMAEEEY